MAPSVGETGNLTMCQCVRFTACNVRKLRNPFPFLWAVSCMHLVLGLGWIRRRTILIEIVYSRKDEKPQGFCFLFRCWARSLLNRTCFGQSVGFCSFSFYLGFEKRLSINRDIALWKNYQPGVTVLFSKLRQIFKNFPKKLAASSLMVVFSSSCWTALLSHYL